jgi:hypothetical protein
LFSVATVTAQLPGILAAASAGLSKVFKHIGIKAHFVVPLDSDIGGRDRAIQGRCRSDPGSGGRRISAEGKQDAEEIVVRIDLLAPSTTTITGLAKEPTSPGLAVAGHPEAGGGCV